MPSHLKTVVFTALVLLLLQACHATGLDYRYVEIGFIPKAAILTYPLISLGISSFLPLRTSLCLVLIGGTLFLPERVEFDLPLVPPLSKHNIPALTALLLVSYKQSIRLNFVKSDRAILLLTIILIIGAIFTVLGNPEQLVNGPVKRPGLGKGDMLSIPIREMLAVIFPFWAGRVLFFAPQDPKKIARTLLILSG